MVEKVRVEILEVDKVRKRVIAKIGRQRKPDSFLVMVTDKGNIIAQGSRSICIIDPSTGMGKYNTKGNLFPHLNVAMGAKVGEFPEEFINALLEVETKPGEILGYIEGAPVFFGGASEI